MSTLQHLILGDSRIVLKEIADLSVNLIITSPPYWCIKDYAEHPDQIGFDQDYDEYIDDLREVWSECYRVLHTGCKMVINVGDMFLSAEKYGRYRIIPIHADIIKSCREIGFDYMGMILWEKATNTATSGGGSWLGSTYYPRDGGVWQNFEFILIFKKIGELPEYTEEQKKRSRLTKKERTDFFQPRWNFSGEKQTDHPAPFPLELPKRIIKMFSFYGETVLDPFLGSGTTMQVCKLLGRNCIGIEINKTYLPAIKKKVNWGISDIVNKTVHKITETV